METHIQEDKDQVDTKIDVNKMWHAYKLTADRQIRDKIIIQYSPLVKFVASRVGAGLPKSVELADLISYGMFGLIDAIEKFEPDRGIKFETYAMTRIRGAIIDELRAIDWVPRSVRTRIKEVDETYSKLESNLGRPPSDIEIAVELGISENDLHSIFRRISAAGVIALDDAFYGRGDRGEQLTVGDTLSDGGDSPGTHLEDAETRKLLSDAVDKLPDRERMVLSLYYFEGLNLSQIGEILGVTESRACQIHAKAVLGLRHAMSAFWRDDP